jgi:cysteine synthase A
LSSPISVDIERRLHGLGRLVGNTPLLAIEFLFRGDRRTLYAKAENLNMTGSIKDRMALHIIRCAYQDGHLKPGDIIIEATSGNTGISFAGVGRAMGHPVTIFMPDWMSTERINLIRAFGAEIHLVSRDEGGFVGSIELAEEMASSMDNAFLPRQFSNEHNIAAHETRTGPEIWYQLETHGLRPDAVLAGVGTGGTIMGTGRYLKTRYPDVKIHPLEPANSPTLSSGCCVGKHRIQGVSDEFVPPIVDLHELDEIYGVDDGDAITMAQKLAREMGIGVGISSGANFLGALKVQNAMGRDAVVVTVLPDDNKKYLSTDLLGDEPVKDGFISPEVRLLGFRAFNRSCQICFDALESTQTEPLGFGD